MSEIKSRELEKDFPVFYKTANYLKNRVNFFKYSLPKLFDANYNYELAERLCKIGLEISSNDWGKYFKNVDGLIYLSLDFLKLQVNLEKTRKYLYSSFKEVEENIYSKTNQHEEGPNYLWGLYFSEVFWKIHHNFFNFFLKNFVDQRQNHGTILEIPSGTGFFLSEFLRENPEWRGTGIDLADTAIAISEMVLNANNIPKKSYNIIKKNFLDFDAIEKFDRIICGEFLEHVEDPLKILMKLNSLLKENGKIFLTVAVWAAGIDHIYLYTNPQEVRDHTHQAGFHIEKELVQSVFEKDEGNPEKGNIPVSYAAILLKK